MVLFETNMVKPSFFIIGAPKCGTTSLYHYLSQHPGIYMPQAKKETGFWSPDVPVRQNLHDKNVYLSLFSGARAGQIAGEASTNYLYSRCAPTSIKEFNPYSRIIVSFRNPVDMLHSLHSEFLWLGVEQERDFERCMQRELVAQGATGGVGATVSPGGIPYLKRARYDEYLKRYLEVFGHEKVMVIVFDDLQRQSRAVVSDIYRFLCVDVGFVPNLEPRNRSKRPRNLMLRRLASTIPMSLEWRVRLLLPPPVLRILTTMYRKATSIEVERQPLSDTLRGRLAKEFEPSILRLGDMIGRDLTGWLLKEKE